MVPVAASAAHRRSSQVIGRPLGPRSARMQVQLHGHPGKSDGLSITMADVAKEAYTNRVEINCSQKVPHDQQL